MYQQVFTAPIIKNVRTMSFSKNVPTAKKAGAQQIVCVYAQYTELVSSTILNNGYLIEFIDTCDGGLEVIH